IFFASFAASRLCVSKVLNYQPPPPPPPPPPPEKPPPPPPELEPGAVEADAVALARLEPSALPRPAAVNRPLLTVAGYQARVCAVPARAAASISAAKRSAQVSAASSAMA